MQTRKSSSQSTLCLLGVFILSAALTLTSWGAQSAGGSKPQVDVNSADAKTLETLPGIGSTLAQRIIAGRPYKDIEDLQHVKGLSSAKLNTIKDEITFGPATAPATQKSTKSHTKSVATETSPQTSAAPGDQSSTARQQPARAPSPTGSSAGHLAPGQTVNINTATAEELDALPGIGHAKAQAIIDYRNQHGPFNSIEDIQKVKGIKAGEFAKLKDHITVK